MDEIAAEAPRRPQGDPTPERDEIIRERGIDPIGGMTPAKRNTALIFAGTAMVLGILWVNSGPSKTGSSLMGKPEAIAKRPDLAARIDELTWMGGGLSRGNHTASAEFNALADPEAVAVLLSHGLPLRMVDLDFCRKVLAAPEDIEPVRNAGGTNAALLADMLAGYIDIGVSRGRPAMAIYDPSAAAAFIRPDLVTFQPARIDMELAGSLTRGRTVVETRASHGAFNAEFAADCDAAAIKAIVLDALLWEAGK